MPSMHTGHFSILEEAALERYQLKQTHAFVAFSCRRATLRHAGWGHTLSSWQDERGCDLTRKNGLVYWIEAVGAFQCLSGVSSSMLFTRQIREITCLRITWALTGLRRFLSILALTVLTLRCIFHICRRVHVGFFVSGIRPFILQSSLLMMLGKRRRL